MKHAMTKCIVGVMKPYRALSSAGHYKSAEGENSYNKA